MCSVAADGRSLKLHVPDFRIVSAVQRSIGQLVLAFVQSMSVAFGKEDLDLAEELVTQLRYLTTAGDAISLKL